MGAPTTYTANVLTVNALSVLEKALWDQSPNERYSLLANNKYSFTLPCRSSLRFNNNNKTNNTKSNQKLRNSANKCNNTVKTISSNTLNHLQRV